VIKKAISFIFALIIFVSCAMPLLLRAEDYLRMVVDDADLLTDSEEASLAERIGFIVEQYNFDVVILTVNSIDGQTPEAFADDYYDYNDYRDDGVLFLLNMGERDWYISTKGYGITAFTDYGIQQTGSNVLPSLGEGNYFQAFSIFLDDAEGYLSLANDGNSYDIGGDQDDYDITGGNDYTNEYYTYSAVDAFAENLPIGIIAGIIISLIIVLVMKGQLKTARAKPFANDFVKRNSLQLINQSDVFTHSTVSKVHRSTNDSHDGGSSTHTSSSGSTHGGGGGKF
jgi:uncharacterized protein